MASNDPYSRNPYAPSKASLGSRAGKPDVSSDVSVWRDGKTVVTLHDASLPSRCVKCNEPADQPTKERTLYWVHPAVYLLLFAGGLILLIVYLVVRKKAEVNPGCAMPTRSAASAHWRMAGSDSSAVCSSRSPAGHPTRPESCGSVC